MNALPLALSLTSSFTKVGAIAGFAALLGIALLSLLAFSQAREIKRLREWAGRAPERAAEMEQRVSTEAAARMQRGAAQAAGAAAGARVVPRKTPLVSAPVSTAVNATVAAGKIGVPPDPGAAERAAVADPANPAVVNPAAESPANPAVGGPAQANPAVAAATQSGAAQPNAAIASTAQADSDRLGGSPVTPPGADGAEQPLVNDEVSAASQQGSAAEQDQQASVSPRDVEQPGPAPATAAARAAVPVARAPLPPSPSAPAPPGAPPSTAPGVAASVSPASVAAATAAKASQPAPSQPAPARPSAPVAVARPATSRAVAGTSARAGSRGAESGAPTRKPVSPARGGDAASGAARMPDAPVGSGPKYFKRERSAGRMTLLVVGGVVLGVAVIVLAVSALKGGSKPSPTVTRPSTSSTVAHTSRPTPASNPSELNVAVLNGTSTNGLAHHLADDLRQSGYEHAEASSAVPPGTHATTVVQYKTGHRADGQAVAKALDVTRVQPMETSTASLAAQATVVVVAGTDQATQLGGGGAQSTGEPSAGANGEAGTGAGGASAGTAAAGEGSGAGGGAEGAAGSGQ